MTDLITARGLTKRYNGTAVLDDVSLSVSAGCVTGFVGANGAGKTTTIRALMGLMEVDAGEVVVFGEPFGPRADDACARRLKERIGVVFDTCPFIGDLPVKTAGVLMRASYPSWDQRCFDGLLARFALDPAKKIKDLSRGMGMKLSLICALSHNPDLLVLDEATAGLDPLAREQALDALRLFMNEPKHAIFMSSHITSDLEKIADYIVCIDGGRIVFAVEKDAITDFAGVAQCRAAEFDAVVDSGFFAPGTLHFERSAYGTAVLVPDRLAFAARFPQIVLDRADIDAYMSLMLKGDVR